MSEPTLMQKAKSVTYSAIEWARAGFPVVSDEEYAKRSAICHACPFFDQNAFFGDGKCTKCGCDFKLKSKMATESCPEDKWGPAEAVKV